MKIYTRTGDAGETGLFGGGRVSKHHPRVAAYGAVDELNAFLGQAAVTVSDRQVRQRLEQLQHDLFNIGSALATAPPEQGRPRPAAPPLPSARIAEMEDWIDQVTQEVEPLREFILPGGTPGAAALHVARTVCRRAEREVTALGGGGGTDPDVIRYLNRLSDLLFSLARLENARSDTPDVMWRKGD